MIALALVLAPLLTANASYEAALSTEFRSGDASPVSAEGATHAELMPRIGLDLELGADTLRVDYAPRLLLVGAADQRAMHEAHVDLRWRPNRSWQLRLRQRASYGDNEYWPVEGLTGGGGLPEPLPQGTNFYGFETRLGVDGQLSRRLRLETEGAWNVRGGVEAAARTAVPTQSGPRLDANLRFVASRRDMLGLRLDAQATHLSDGRDAAAAALTAGWERRLSRRTEALLGFGLGLADEQGDSAYMPVAAVGLRHRVPLRGQQLAGGLQLRLAPFLNRFTGLVDQSAELNGYVDWAWRERVILTLATVTWFPLEGTMRGQALGTLEGRLEYRIDRDLRLVGGVRGYWQGDPNPYHQLGPYFALAYQYRGVF